MNWAKRRIGNGHGFFLCLSDSKPDPDSFPGNLWFVELGGVL